MSVKDSPNTRLLNALLLFLPCFPPPPHPPAAVPSAPFIYYIVDAPSALYALFFFLSRK